MGISFLSPWSALVALAGAAPLAAYIWSERRAARVAARIGLRPSPPRARIAATAALVLLPLLVGAAAAEPVADRNQTRYTRDDAEAFFVFDTSRSMLARLGPNGATRLERARAEAIRLRAALGDVKIGVASMTDRTLPYLFPTADESVFANVVRQSVGIETPPPSQDLVRVTTLHALAAVANRNFFSDNVPHRLVVIFSDTESVPFAEQELATLFRKPPRIRTIFVRFWDARERVYVRSSLPEAGYLPDPASALVAQRLAAATGGAAFREDQLGKIVATARRYLGPGRARAHGQERGKWSLAPYTLLAGALPLGFLLWRRNL